MASISSLRELNHIKTDAELISFDVFDTLVYRRFLKVNEVHDLTSAYALALTGRFGGAVSPGDLTLTRPVITANLKASPHYQCEEPTLTDIWTATLAATADRTEEIASLAQRIADFEFAVETRNLYPVEGAREALADLKAKGKRLVAVSDMYFSQEQVTRLLKEAGLLQFLDKVYVSATENLTKQTGNLFRRVWKDQRVSPGNTLHVGDNPLSDLERPESLGGQALLVRQEHLCTIQWPDFGKRESIYQEMGDLVKVFLFQLYLHACHDKSDGLYFMSRDGILLREFLTRWHSSLLAEAFPPFVTETLFLSRASTCWLNIDFTGAWLEQAIGHVFWLNNGKATPRQISALCGITEIPASLEADRLYHADRDTQAIVAHYRTAQLENTIKWSIQKKRQDVLDYLKGTGFFQKQEVHVSDIGYSGTVLRDLNTFFLQERQQGLALTPPHIHFHCLATNDNFAGNAIRAYPHVTFQQDVLLPHTVLGDDLKDSFSWLEYFFKHPRLGPLLGFRRKNGQTVPDYTIADHVNPNHPFEKLLARATDTPEDIIFFWMAAINFPNPLRDPLLHRFAHPDPATVSQMAEKIYESDALHSESRSILHVDATLPEWDLREAARRQDAWIPGSLLVSRMARQEQSRQDSCNHGASSSPSQQPSPQPSPQKKESLYQSLKTSLLGLFLPQGLHNADRESFDPAFYRQTYPDLAYMESDEELERHFRLHGYFLGRFGTGEALRHYSSKHALPLEKPQEAHKRLSPHPSPERPPARAKNVFHADQALQDEFEALYQAGTIKTDSREAARLRAEDHPLEAAFSQHGLIPGQWINELELTSFKALNHDWCPPVKTRAEALLAFMQQGIARCAPISTRLAFDPDFYHRQNPGLVSLSAEEAYRHWLNQGHAEGRAPSRLSLLHDATGGIEDLALSRPEQMTTADPDMFKRFITAPMLDKETPAVMRENADLWAARARHARRHGRTAEAIDFLHQAARQAPERGSLWHELGDWFLEDQKESEALAAFEAGLCSPTPHRWSFIHAIRLNSRKGQFSTALRYLEQGAAPWQHTAPWREARAYFFHNWLEQETDRLSRQPGAQAHLKAFLVEFAATMGRIGLPDPTPLARPEGPICIMTGSGLDRHVHLQNALRPPAPGGQRFLLFSPEQTDDLHAALPGAAMVIYNHVPMTAPVLESLLRADRLGLRTLFWAGPLADGRTVGLPDLSDLAFSDFQRAGHAASFGHGLLDVALAMFSHDVVTTMPSLLPTLHELNEKTILLPSSLVTSLRTSGPFLPDPSTLPEDEASAPLSILLILTGRPASRGGAAHHPTAFFKGSSRHEVLASLTPLLASRPGIRLFVEGMENKAELPHSLRHKSELLLPAPTDAERLAFMAAMDLVLDARSMTGDQRMLWADSVTGHTALLQLGDEAGDSTGLQATGPAECLVSSCTALQRRLPPLLAEPAARNRLVQDAMAALARLAPASGKHDWAPPHPLPLPAGKPRILFANIYAPPQVIGGATRVLMDNLTYFRTHAADMFEPYILASDNENARRGEQLVDTWEGIPVFRMATPQETDMDWRTYNAEMDACTRRILSLLKPELVHIHCLTRLSVAVAEACMMMGIPYIITVHDAWWISDFAFLTDEDGTPATLNRNPAAQSYSHRIGLPRSLERAARLRAALLNAKRVLGVSESFSELFRRIGIPVQTIENGVSSLVPHDRTPGTPGTVRLGHLGGLEYHKGAYLLEAALRSGDFRHLSLTILDHAMDPGATRQTCWGGTPVTIRGKLPHGDISRFYAATDVLVAPSTWPESYGLVAREALLCGCWVIANKAGAMGEDIMEGENGFLVTTETPQALATILARINANPSLYQAPPARQVSIRHTNAQARDLLALYRTLLGPQA